MSGDNSPSFTGLRRSIAQQDSEQRGKNVWVSRPAEGAGLDCTSSLRQWTLSEHRKGGAN